MGGGFLTPRSVGVAGKPVYVPKMVVLRIEFDSSICVISRFICSSLVFKLAAWFSITAHTLWGIVIIISTFSAAVTSSVFCVEVFFSILPLPFNNHSLFKSLYARKIFSIEFRPKSLFPLRALPISPTDKWQSIVTWLSFNPVSYTHLTLPTNSLV